MLKWAQRTMDEIYRRERVSEHVVVYENGTMFDEKTGEVQTYTEGFYTDCENDLWYLAGDNNWRCLTTLKGKAYTAPSGAHLFEEVLEYTPFTRKELV